MINCPTSCSPVAKDSESSQKFLFSGFVSTDHFASNCGRLSCAISLRRNSLFIFIVRLCPENCPPRAPAIRSQPKACSPTKSKNHKKWEIRTGEPLVRVADYMSNWIASWSRNTTGQEYIDGGAVGMVILYEAAGKGIIH